MVHTFKIYVTKGLWSPNSSGYFLHQAISRPISVECACSFSCMYCAFPNNKTKLRTNRQRYFFDGMMIMVLIILLNSIVARFAPFGNVLLN